MDSSAILAKVVGCASLAAPRQELRQCLGLLMARSSSTHIVLAATLAIGTAQCARDPLAPRTLQGTFELRSVGLRSLPAVYDSSAYGISTAVHGSLSFVDSARVVWSWVEHQVFRYSLNESFRESDYSYQATLPYTLHDGKLTIGDPCPPDPGGNCAAPIPGTHLEPQVILRPVFSRAGAWTFLRVGS
jgi:hypothetical protein